MPRRSTRSARGEWVTAPENLILAGPIGTGKTHLVIAPGVEAAKQKRRVLFARAADLVRQLPEARDGRELRRLQHRLLRVDVLIIDELGSSPSSAPAASCCSFSSPTATSAAPQSSRSV